MEAAAQLLSPAFLNDEINGVEGTRIGNADVNYVTHGVYSVEGEDNWLAIACEEDSQWVSLSRVIGAHHLSSLGVDERRERE